MCPTSTSLKLMNTVPEFIDRVFVKTSPKRSFLVIENARFGLVLTKTGSINSGTGVDVVKKCKKVTFAVFQRFFNWTQRKRREEVWERDL